MSQDPVQRRRLAEQDLAARGGLAARALDQAEALGLVHELQVHQIELEMQNAELQRAREEMEALVEAYTDLYDYAPVGYLVLNRQGEIQRANLTAAALLGTERSQVVGRLLLHWIADPGRRVFTTFLEHHFAGSAPKACELPLKGSEGVGGWIRLEASWPSQLQECRVAFVDITEQHQAEEDRKRYEAETQHAQQLESLGRLAAGVAHDVNNTLGAIFAVVETLKLKATVGGDLTGDLALIEKAAIRGRDLVGGLTRFSRKDSQNLAPIDLHALARNEIRLLEQLVPQAIRFTLTAEEPYPFVFAQVGQISSAVMNLCVNGTDAMPGGGQLTLRIHRLPERMVGLSVTDTGLGMSPDILAHAIEPFFTTKFIGFGTGQGLSMAYATAKACGGDLLLQSMVGEGTTVTLVLPEYLDSMGFVQKDLPRATQGQPMTILFVDDNELMRDSIPPMFEGQGHKVIVAPGGPEALVFLSDRADVDLIILDQNMPVMTGLETLKEIRLTHPTKPVLLATGNLEPDIERIIARDDHARCIEKPFSFREISRVIQELLPRKDARG